MIIEELPRQYKQLGFVTFHSIIPKDVIKKVADSKNSIEFVFFFFFGVVVFFSHFFFFFLGKCLCMLIKEGVRLCPLIWLSFFSRPILIWFDYYCCYYCCFEDFVLFFILFFFLIDQTNN